MREGDAEMEEGRGRRNGFSGAQKRGLEAPERGSGARYRVLGGWRCQNGGAEIGL